jgi:adenylate cyclase
VTELPRRLTAILSADVQGYSRLMGLDEADTVRTLTTHRNAMATLVQRHHGRVVDAPGDNLLAEFPSIVEAVRAGAAIQATVTDLNARRAPARPMLWRIGINLGDVLADGERIYGDGVNIAARVQELASGGEVCVSGSAHDQVEGKVEWPFVALGEHAVKNIARPVRVYRVAIPTTPAQAQAVPADLQSQAFEESPSVRRFWTSELTLPDRPSIVILPFQNIGGDAGQEHLADGMTEDLVTMLSKVSGMFVIASNTAFTYKGRAINVPAVARELGVRYVLEGSVRRADNRLRITTQLIDATTGYHVWAERYDREITDIFTLQDEIARAIVVELQVLLTEGESARLAHRGTRSVPAWEHCAQGTMLLLRAERDGNARAREHALQAVALDPSFPGAHVLLGTTYWFDLWQGWTDDPAGALDHGRTAAERALSLDNTWDPAYSLLSILALLRGQHAEASALGERAVALSPGSATAAFVLSWVLGRCGGREEEAIGLAKRALRLSPQGGAWPLAALGGACYFAGKYQDACDALLAYSTILPNNPRPLFWLAAACEAAGHRDEARKAVQRIRQLDPTFTLANATRQILHSDPVKQQRMIDDLRRAGLS